MYCSWFHGALFKYIIIFVHSSKKSFISISSALQLVIIVLNSVHKYLIVKFCILSIDIKWFCAQKVWFTDLLITCMRMKRNVYELIDLYNNTTKCFINISRYDETVFILLYFVITILIMFIWILNITNSLIPYWRKLFYTFPH